MSIITLFVIDGREFFLDKEDITNYTVVRIEKVLGANKIHLQLKLCSNCTFWEFYKCKNSNICENGDDDDKVKNQLVYSYSESGCFYTGQDFGCVHFEPDSSWIRK